MSDQTEQYSLEAHQTTAVQDYLAAELDPQIGRAEDRFRQYLTEQPSIASDPLGSSFNRFGGGRFRGWVFSLAGAAMAACLGFVLGGPRFHAQPTPNASTTAPNASSPVGLPWVQQQTIDSQTYDDGGTMLDADGNPVRVLRRRQWDRTRWFDEHKQLRAETVVPRDETVYVQMKTY
jgi:hypothetical protein